MRILPPVWFVLAIIAMVVLAHFVPLVQWHLAPMKWAGIALIAVGLATAVTAARHFKRAGTPLRPFSRASALVTTGPFRFTRNPMYLGLAVVLVGVALALQSLTPFLVIPAFVAIITLGFILPEEAMLKERFGDDYAAFQSRVRRWL